MNVIMSLNRPILCPFQGLLDIANQLTDGNANVLTAQRVFEPVFELNTINDWVNVDDSLGDLTPIRAKELVDTLDVAFKKQTIKSLTIDIDLGDCALTIDNYFALLFLSETLNNLVICFYVSPEKIKELQALTKNLHERDNCVIYYRHAKHFSESSHLAQLSEDLNTKRDKALVQNGFELDKGLNLGSLISYAWTCLKAGAYPLGCQVLSSILSQPDLDGLIFEELFVHLQIIRFLSHQHHLVIAETFPEVFHFVGQERIKHLYFIKAFSATLTRNLPIAEDYFKKADINQTMLMTDEDSMYKLNLYALFLLLKGEPELAFQIELRIQNHIQAHHKNAAALQHVVFMNIARLYKKSKEYQLSAENYAKAYEQLSSGGFTLFDHMSHSMDVAILDEVRGRAKEALFSWVKVAIHWITCANPYSLAVKQRLVLCQENITQTLMPLSVEKVNRFLLDKLTYLCVLANINYETKDDDVFSFVSDESINLQKDACYVANNLILYSCSLPARHHNRPVSALESDLHRVISSLIRIGMPIASKEVQAIAIDTKHDCFYPQSEAESVALALLSNCSSYSYNGKLGLIDTDKSEPALAKVDVIPSKMIQSIQPTETGLQLIYKRSFLNKHLDIASEIDALQTLNKNEQPSRVTDYCPDVLKQLFEKKVISFHFDLDVV